MVINAFWNDVISQNRDALASYFCDDAIIRWHCTNEQFSVSEYIKANCDYPGNWAGEIERIEEMESLIVLAGRVHPADKEMKVAIAYYSQHHGNTKKLLDAIAKKHEVTLIDVTKKQEYDLRDFDLIGFASGVYYGKLAKQVVSFAQINLPDEKDVFLIYTYGGIGNDVASDLNVILNKRRARVAGEYHCFGWDTYWIFKPVGGIKKGHPTKQEIAGAVDFFDGLMKD